MGGLLVLIVGGTVGGVLAAMKIALTTSKVTNSRLFQIQIIYRKSKPVQNGL